MQTHSIIVHRDRYDFIEVEMHGQYSTFQAFHNAKNIGTVKIPTHLNPSFSVQSSNELSLYSGLYLYMIIDGKMTERIEDQDISAVWKFAGEIIVVCDAYIACRSETGLSAGRRYEHDDIIIESSPGESGKLRFTDLQNRHYSLDLSTFAVEQCAVELADFRD